MDTSSAGSGRLVYRAPASAYQQRTHSPVPESDSHAKVTIVSNTTASDFRTKDPRKRGVILFGLLFLFACGHSPKPYAVFDYEDFGPQVMAWESIGMQWWQWDRHGDSDPDARCDIKVVVYRGGELIEMQRLFPVNRARRQDFRYFEYRAAISYLNGKISSLNQEDASWAIDLRQRLIETRERIENEIEPAD